MNQFSTLLWLKWKLALSQIRTPKAMIGQVLLLLLGGLVFALSILGSFGIFISLSLLTLNSSDRLAGMTLNAMLMLYLSSFYLMWLMVAVVPARGGGTFDPSLLLHYPLPLRRLFFLDVSSEIFKGISLPMLPPMLAVHLTIPALQGRWGWGLVPFALNLILGALVVRTVELLIARVSQRGKSAGENAAALGGVVMVGVILGATVLGAQFMRVLERNNGWEGMVLQALPMSLTAKTLLAGGRGDLMSWLEGIGGLLIWVALLLPLCLHLWRVMALGMTQGGGPPEVVGPLRLGWQVPGLSNVMSALVEKEFKYLWRNSQVRALLVLSVAVLMFKLASKMPVEEMGSKERWLLDLMGRSQLLDGADMAMMVFYVSLFYFALWNNAFGLDGGGFRTLILAPVSRRELLLSRNLALCVLMWIQGGVLLVGGAVFFRDTTGADVAVVMCSVASVVPVLAGIGNLVSSHFPRRSEFGAKITTSPWAVLLLLVELPLGFWPILLGFWAGYTTDSYLVKYCVMAGGALFSTLLYAFWLLPWGVKVLETRERLILQTITGGDE